MIAILGGLLSAACFTATGLAASRTARMLGAFPVLAWVMIVGLVLVLPFVLVQGAPSELGSDEVAWLALVGIGNVTGLLVSYEAMRHGKVGLVAPIVSTEGAIAAALSLALGERVAALTAVGMVVVTVGVVVAAVAPDADLVGSDHRVRVPVLAGIAAVCFGASLFAAGRVGDTVSVAIAALPARLVGVVAIAAPLALAGRLRLTRRAAPLLVLGGVCEVGGIAAFVVGARHGLAVTAVLSAQFAGLTALAAFVLFRERLSRLQIAGIVTIAVGVTLLAVGST